MLLHILVLLLLAKAGAHHVLGAGFEHTTCFVRPDANGSTVVKLELAAPEREPAWTYSTHILRELSTLAERHEAPAFLRIHAALRLRGGAPAAWLPAMRAHGGACAEVADAHSGLTAIEMEDAGAQRDLAQSVAQRSGVGQLAASALPARFSRAAARKIMLQAVWSLAAAQHKLGFRHWDLQLANVVLSPTAERQLMVFGDELSLRLLPGADFELRFIDVDNAHVDLDGAGAVAQRVRMEDADRGHPGIKPPDFFFQDTHDTACRKAFDADLWALGQLMIAFGAPELAAQFRQDSEQPLGPFAAGVHPDTQAFIEDMPVPFGVEYRRVHVVVALLQKMLGNGLLPPDDAGFGPRVVAFFAEREAVLEYNYALNREWWDAQRRALRKALGDAGLDLLRAGLMPWDAADRPRAADLLAHPYFDRFRGAPWPAGEWRLRRFVYDFSSASPGVAVSPAAALPFPETDGWDASPRLRRLWKGVPEVEAPWG